MPEENLVKVTFTWAASGGPDQTGFHLIHGSDTTDSAIETLAEALAGDADVKAKFRALLIASEVWQTLTVARVPRAGVSGEAIYESVQPLYLAGTRSDPSDWAPRELGAMLFTKTGFGGRRWHGRMWPPALYARNEIDTEEFTSSGAYNTALAAWVTELEKLVQGHDHAAYSDGWDMTVYSRAASLAGESIIHRRVQAIGYSRDLHWLRSRGK